MSDTRAVRPGRLWPKTPRGSARKFRRAMKRQALEDAQWFEHEALKTDGELDLEYMVMHDLKYGQSPDNPNRMAERDYIADCERRKAARDEQFGAAEAQLNARELDQEQYLYTGLPHPAEDINGDPPRP